MADFKQVIGHIRKHEGGYVNDPQDAGGETYCGITRKNFPHWEGWVIVDRYKPLKYNQIIADKLLEDMVDTFYYKTKWCAVYGDKINSQQVAYMLMDWYVNSGTHATRALQRIVGVKSDGVIGPASLKAINDYPEVDLVEKYKQARIDFYHKIVVRRPANAKFLNGWLARVATIDNHFSIT